MDFYGNLIRLVEAFEARRSRWLLTRRKWRHQEREVRNSEIAKRNWDMTVKIHSERNLTVRTTSKNRKSEIGFSNLDARKKLTLRNSGWRSISLIGSANWIISATGADLYIWESLGQENMVPAISRNANKKVRRLRLRIVTNAGGSIYGSAAVQSRSRQSAAVSCARSWKN